MSLVYKFQYFAGITVLTEINVHVYAKKLVYYNGTLKKPESCLKQILTKSQIQMLCYFNLYKVNNCLF